MKHCQVCQKPYTPQRMGQVVCSPVCAIKMARASVKKRLDADKQEKREHKAKKEAAKTRQQWLAEAKTAMQAMRRLEELAKGRGCMSCGRSQQEVEAGDWRPGGYWDGGHFKSKGAFPELALEPLNIWLQCKSCNAGSGKYARKGYTVNSSFEAGLVAAEGQDLVDWLNGPHKPKHYDIDDLKAIIQHCKTRVKELKK